MYDDDIALIKAQVLRQEADKIEKMGAHEDCSCNPAADHRHDCPRGIWFHIARLLRMDAEG